MHYTPYAYTSDLISIAWLPKHNDILIVSRGLFLIPSPDGRYIASRADVNFYSIADSAEIKQHIKSYNIPALRRSGVQIWDTTTDSPLVGYQDGALAGAWSPDSKYIAFATTDRTVQIWDVTTGRAIITYPGYLESPPYGAGIDWSPDGNYLAYTCSAGETQIWSAPEEIKVQ